MLCFSISTQNDYWDASAVMGICNGDECQQKTMVSVANLFHLACDPGYFKSEEKLKWQPGDGNHS